MKYLIVAFSLLFLSCEEKQIQTDFDQRVIDLLIETRNGREIEMPDLYGKIYEIPDGKSESLLLSTKLQSRGFKIIETTNAVQGITGVHKVIQTLTKNGCDCVVTKTYNRTAFVGVFAVSEKIKCD